MRDPEKVKRYNREGYKRHREERIKYRAEYYKKNRELLKEKQRIIRENVMHLCPSCQLTMINALAKHCRSCAAKISNASFKKNYTCKECGRPVSDKLVTRCRDCAFKGELHPGWNGGKRLAKTGYILIWQGNNSEGRTIYKPEHRIIWEQVYGELPKGYYIHHLNGNKVDNRIENMILVTKKEHGSMHCPKGVRVGKQGKGVYQKVIL